MGSGFIWAIVFLVATIILAVWLVRILFPSTNEPSEPSARSSNPFVAHGELLSDEGKSTYQNRTAERERAGEDQ